ncbi:hypothetical protein HAX54_030397, partial [Datura stramonium]|nr:hypothetical protein [Datura stramonium]
GTQCQSLPPTAGAVIRDGLLRQIPHGWGGAKVHYGGIEVVRPCRANLGEILSPSEVTRDGDTCPLVYLRKIRRWGGGTKKLLYKCLNASPLIDAF